MKYSLIEAPVAEEFYWDRHRISMLMGPVGSGKSIATIQKIIKLAAEQEPNEKGVRHSRVAVVRNTYSQLQDTTIESWREWFPWPEWGMYRKSENEFDMEWALDDDTIVKLEVWFRGLDRPDQIANLMSAEYSFAWFNEVRFIDKDIFMGMRNRIGRFPKKNEDGTGGATLPCILMDTNPCDRDHWVYTLFEEDKPKSARAFYQPSGLSPEAENTKFLPATYYQDLMEGADEYYVNVYVHGKYGYLREGSPVYPEYNDKVHCDPEIEALPMRPIYIGLDFGLTPACVVGQLNVSGQLLILDEITSTRAGIRQFLDVVKPYLAQTYPGNPIEAWYCDPAGNQGSQTDMKTPFDVMYENEIYPQEGEQNPEIRIESVKQLLNKMIDGEPAIVISHRAKMLRKGFSGAYHYRRMKVSKERYADKPDKNEVSHVHDALQYLCTRLFTVSQTKRGSRPPKVVGMRKR